MLPNGIIVYSTFNKRRLSFRHPDNSKKELAEYLKYRVLWEITGWNLVYDQEILVGDKPRKFRYLVQSRDGQNVFGIPTNDGLKVVVFLNDIVDALIYELSGFVCNSILIVEVVGFE